MVPKPRPQGKAWFLIQDINTVLEGKCVEPPFVLCSQVTLSQFPFHGGTVIVTFHKPTEN